MCNRRTPGAIIEKTMTVCLVILGSIGTAPDELKIKPLFNILINKIRIFEVIILLMFFAETIQISTCYYTNEKKCYLL